MCQLIFQCPFSCRAQFWLSWLHTVIMGTAWVTLVQGNSQLVCQSVNQLVQVSYSVSWSEPIVRWVSQSVSHLVSWSVSHLVGWSVRGSFSQSVLPLPFFFFHPLVRQLKLFFGSKNLVNWQPLFYYYYHLSYSDVDPAKPSHITNAIESINMHFTYIHGHVALTS